ncbi:MAG TPA: archaeal proteasome endopeptidase complex subunit alpha [Candidatus Korarchaeota archaeon]|nr:archaeal proteasome endopeptidase complex subunit alpha [Candidatus Korarchaeota archaeon]
MFPQMASGYDRAITVFSPDGRLLQVEYALAATKRTPLAIGIKSAGGVVLVASRRPTSPLASPPEKIYKIDEHIGAIAAGLIGDGLVLVDRSRVEAQYHRLIYGEPIVVRNLAKRVALFKQQFTQYAGLRPFGVIMIYGGVDQRPELFVTHPGGAYYSYSAFAVGRNSEKVNEFLKENYKYELDLKETIFLVFRAITEASETKEELRPENLEIAVIPADEKKFKTLSHDEVRALLEEWGGPEEGAQA